MRGGGTEGVLDGGGGRGQGRGVIQEGSRLVLGGGGIKTF